MTTLVASTDEVNRFDFSLQLIWTRMKETTEDEPDDPHRRHSDHAATHETCPVRISLLMLVSVLATILTSFLAFSAAVDAREVGGHQMTLDIEALVRLLSLSFVGLWVIVHDFNGDTVQVC